MASAMCSWCTIRREAAPKLALSSGRVSDVAPVMSIGDWLVPSAQAENFGLSPPQALGPDSPS